MRLHYLFQNQICNLIGIFVLKINIEPILQIKGQSKAFLTAFGHCAEHWVGATFIILLPYLKKDLGFSYFEAGILVSIYHASAFVSNFAGAAAIDMSGRRVIFLTASLAASGLALLSFGITENYYILCFLISIIGGANYLWHPASIAFLSEQFPKNKGYIFSIHAIGANIGDALAPMVAGILIAALSWKQSAMINSIPVIIAAIIIFIYLIPKEKGLHGSLSSGITWSTYLDGFKGLIKNKVVIGLAGIASTRQIAQTVLIMFIPLYLQGILKVSPVTVGVSLAVMQIGGFLATPIAGALSDNLGRRPVIKAGLLGSTILIFALTFIDNKTLYISCLGGVGFCLYATRPVLQGWIMDITPPNMGASATGMIFGIQSIFATFAPLLGGAIADTYGIIYVFYFVSFIIVISNIIAALLPKDANETSLS